MKKLILISLISVLCFLSAARLSAQVTIGSGTEPVEGSLLQLKENDNSENNSAKGLALPRVTLISSTIPTGKSLAQTIDGTPTSENWDMDQHIGLIVYNTNTCLNNNGDAQGLYLWDGSQWQFIGVKKRSAEVKEYTDARDGEIYLYRKFGGAGEWMLENLRYVPKDADGYYNYIHSSTGSFTNKYYAYCEGNEDPYIPANHPSANWTLYKKNGLFYNWPAAINMGNGGGLETPDPGNTDQSQGQPGELTTGVQGVCPQGWHVPSDKEWNDLEREIYNNAHLYSTYTETEKNTWTPWMPDWETTTNSWRPQTATEAHGKAMKIPCQPYGSPYNYLIPGKSLSVEQGGFSIIMVGSSTHGYNSTYGVGGDFWSSSNKSTIDGWRRRIDFNRAPVNRFALNKDRMFSIRCKKD